MLHFWIGSNCNSDVIFRRLHFWIYDEPNQTRMLNKNFGLWDKKLRLLVNMRILSNIFVESNKWLKLVPYISVRESVFAFISWKRLQKCWFPFNKLAWTEFKMTSKNENSCSKDNWDDWIYIIIYLSDIPVTFNWLIIVIYPIYFILY